MAAFTTNSMGAMTPYDSGPCSMTRGSDTLGSNMTALGVTNSTPPTTPWKKKKKLKTTLNVFPQVLALFSSTIVPSLFIKAQELIIFSHHNRIENNNTLCHRTGCCQY
jgi:hypothetical protein